MPLKRQTLGEGNASAAAPRFQISLRYSDLRAVGRNKMMGNWRREERKSRPMSMDKDRDSVRKI